MTPGPERLSPDPKVALAAWRWPSSRVLGVFYDVALHSGEAQGWCAVCEGADPWISDLPNGGCVCEARPPFWSCTCPGFTFRDQCRHVVDAIAFLRLEEAREARQAWLNEQLGCHHPLVVNEGSERVCFACGARYSKAAYDVQCLRLRDAIRERHRLPSSPWSAAERSGDTE
jgi:hypothetical protein